LDPARWYLSAAPSWIRPERAGSSSAAIAVLFESLEAAAAPVLRPCVDSVVVVVCSLKRVQRRNDNCKGLQYTISCTVTTGTGAVCAPRAALVAG